MLLVAFLGVLGAFLGPNAVWNGSFQTLLSKDAVWNGPFQTSLGNNAIWNGPFQTSLDLPNVSKSCFSLIVYRFHV